mmetsp:Transcript_42331/g.88836  ORF Transcript_42331/g.88836 Transcript_42331/m.88836 type:complete len:86 (+) Transcript_42331:1142-1399(+)
MAIPVATWHFGIQSLTVKRSPLVIDIMMPVCNKGCQYVIREMIPMSLSITALIETAVDRIIHTKINSCVEGSNMTSDPDLFHYWH